MDFCGLDKGKEEGVEKVGGRDLINAIKIKKL